MELTEIINNKIKDGTILNNKKWNDGKIKGIGGISPR
jgi:hypothetical protein